MSRPAMNVRSLKERAKAREKSLKLRAAIARMRVKVSKLENRLSRLREKIQNYEQRADLLDQDVLPPPSR